MSKDNDPIVPKEASILSKEVSRLKKAAFRAAENRERLPQPMFWSAFGHALSRIKSEKKTARDLRELFEGS